MPNIFSTRELRRRSSILHYEITMLRSIQNIIENGPTATITQPMEQSTHTSITIIRTPIIPGTKPIFESELTINNSLIEAFGIHLRSLLDFFYLKPNSKFPDDLHAEDYYPDPITWERIRPKISIRQLKGIKDRVSHEIAHLPAKRNPKKSMKKWNLSKYMTRVEKLLEIFLSTCQKSNLSDLCKKDLF
jgi:hypothetical protein